MVPRTWSPDSDTDTALGHCVADADSGATTTAVLNPDTDGGGVTDGVEVLIDGTDPLVVASQLANPVEANLDSITAGGTLFRNNCSMCHGAAADGDSPVALRFANAGVTPTKPFGRCGEGIS